MISGVMSGVMSGMKRRSFRAMGTDVALIGAAADPALDDAATAVRAVFEREERRLSRFRTDSELSRVNAAAGAWTPVSPALARLVAFALEAAERTGGRFDPTVLPAVLAAGYDRDLDELPAGVRAAPRPPVPCGRFREVRLEDGRLRMPPDVGLDLGGVAKGWTADLAAQAALALGMPWALVNAGGDLRVAGDAPVDGIAVGVEDPEDPRTELLRLHVRAGALATSCVTKRSWGPGLHHLIDPASGRPADGDVLQATVWAATCVEAEVAAKDALLAGEPYLDRAPGVLVLRDGRVALNLPEAATAS